MNLQDNTTVCERNKYSSFTYVRFYETNLIKCATLQRTLTLGYDSFSAQNLLILYAYELRFR